jgi:hypothetical protein
MASDTRFLLDVAGAIEGSDKSSLHYAELDYLRKYQELFAKWRDEPVNILEIGVRRGTSLRLWQGYFSRATIVGIDIDPSCKSHSGDRIVVEIGSQDDPVFLREVVNKYPPTIIIDDGSHQAAHMVYTFEQLFPALAPGGVYVVEDLIFQFNANAQSKWNIAKAPSAVEYFVNLGRSVMGGRIAAGPTWGTGKYIFDHLESISFLRSATIIHKRGPRGEEGAVEFGLRYIEDNAQAFESEARTRLAEYILKFGGSLDVAAAQLDRAVEISGDPAEVLAVRWQVKMKQNKLGEAIADISRAAELAGTNVGYWLRASALEGQRSGDSGAAEVLRRALNVMPGQPRLATRLKQVSGV